MCSSELRFFLSFFPFLLLCKMVHFDQVLVSLWQLRLQGKNFDYFLLFHFVNSHFTAFWQKAIFPKSTAIWFLDPLNTCGLRSTFPPSPHIESQWPCFKLNIALCFDAHIPTVLHALISIVCSYWCWQSHHQDKANQSNCSKPKAQGTLTPAYKSGSWGGGGQVSMELVGKRV